MEKAGKAPWDLFCRVIDNHGDIGVCWRLASDLAARGEVVRLWIDDASALQWMAPAGVVGVTVRAWPESASAMGNLTPGAVVIEAFGCELPEHYVVKMAQMARSAAPPVWINLEYLTAQSYAERSHLLASPQLSGPGAGLRKWFFYPGFSARTGGLIREADLDVRQRAFDADAWCQSQGIDVCDGEQRVSLFCYEQAALPALLDRLAGQPTLLLATPGHAARQVAQALGPGLQRGALRVHLLPALTQRDYDHLLWACDLNFVRGEDSFVRAQWAGAPFVWQIYPQDDGAQADKLDAFLACFLGHAEPQLAASVRALWQAWNRPGSELPEWPASATWRQMCEAWRSSLGSQADLATQLLDFISRAR